MTSTELRQKFLEFFKEKGHKVIPSASLVPENDPTVLFTTAGMHPLVPFLMGEIHPAGKRLTDVQKCIRTGDIDEVGDTFHHTFFEMLGNWSLGDYFKREAIEWSFEFLTSEKWLHISRDMLAVSVFAGDSDAPFDQEAYDIWRELGIADERIAKLPKKNNWWGPAGETGPCGPDTEMFYWTGGGEAPATFDPEDARWVEIWNDVFMQYNKTKAGDFQPLVQKNVDTGMGLERVLALMNGVSDNYRTDVFWPMIEKIETISGLKYGEKSDEEYIKADQQCWVDTRKQFRVIADHIKAAAFAIGDGAAPSNKDRGYVVRRLIRRAIVKAHQIGIINNFTSDLAKVVFEIYSDTPYFSSHSEEPVLTGDVRIPSHSATVGSFAGPTQDDKQKIILDELEKEETKFRRTLDRGFKILEAHKDTRHVDRMGNTGAVRSLTGEDLFDLYQSYGLPLEISLEESDRLGIPIGEKSIEQFNNLLREHQELSRTASAGMFKGGLADAGDMAVKYHTATHLLHAALRKVLGEHVQQKGSNITAERLRFDFSHAEKMTPEQIKEVEDLVNEQIEKDLPVTMEEMSPEEAKNSGALGFFEHKYGDKVKVYTVGISKDDFFSKEICGGPHVTHTKELGHFKIVKEEASSAGIRRIKAVLE